MLIWVYTIFFIYFFSSFNFCFFILRPVCYDCLVCSHRFAAIIRLRPFILHLYLSVLSLTHSHPFSPFRWLNLCHFSKLPPSRSPHTRPLSVHYIAAHNIRFACNLQLKNNPSGFSSEPDSWLLLLPIRLFYFLIIRFYRCFLCVYLLRTHLPLLLDLYLLKESVAKLLHLKSWALALHSSLSLYLPFPHSLSFTRDEKWKKNVQT